MLHRSYDEEFDKTQGYNSTALRLNPKTIFSDVPVNMDLFGRVKADGSPGRYLSLELT
jgi:hypothetical protein